jgi:hypothetical protein
VALWGVEKSRNRRHIATQYGESVAECRPFFGVSWFVKGEAILGDKPRS